MFLPIFREMPDLRLRSASSRQEIWHFSKREQAYLFFDDFSLLSVNAYLYNTFVVYAQL